MATRFYVNSGGTPPLAALGFHANWERTTDASRHPMARVKQDSALTNTAKQAGSTNDPYDVAHYQFQSEPLLEAGTLTGTFRCRFMGFESSTGADSYPQVMVRVVSGDGSTVRGTAYAGGAQTVTSTTVEFDTTTSPGQNQRFPDSRDASTLTSTAYEVGDRVIVEIGIRHIGAAVATQTATIRRGDATASADLNETANSTTDGDPWIEFTHTFFPPTPAVAAVDTTTINVAATSHVIDLPASTEDGDRLFVGAVMGRNNVSPGTTWPGGWEEKSDTTNVASSAYTLSSAFLDVSGTPPTTVTITTVNNTTCVAIALRIVDYDPAVEPEVTTAIDTANPPSITPSWGSALGMVGTMLASEDGGVTYPYADDQQTVTGIDVGGSLPQIAGCTTNVAGTTIDPASWANIESGLNVLTFAIKAAEDSISLVVGDAVQAQAAESPSLTQVHVAAVGDAGQSQAADSPTVTQVHGLAVSDASHAQAADSPTLAQAHTVVAADATQAQAAEAPSLTQVHQLAASDAAQSQAAESPTLTQAHQLATADATQGQSADNVTLSTSIDLIVADAAHAQSADSPTLVQAHQLAVADSAQAQGAESPSLTQAHQLFAGDAAQGQSAESPTLTQAHQLAAADASSAQTAVAPSLTQLHLLATQDALHGQLADNVGISTPDGLGVNDATSAQTADAPTISQAHNLVADDALHAQTAASPALVEVHQLAVDDAVQAQAAESPALGQLHLLAVADAAQSQSVDSPTLTVGGITLAVADAVHAQTVESPALTQLHLLVTADALHTQTASQVVLGTPSTTTPPVAATYAEAFGDAYGEQSTATHREPAPATYRESA